MGATSNQFFLFLVACVVVYYVAPSRNRWLVLLVGSYAYVLLTSVPAAGFLLFATLISYLVGRRVGRINAEVTDRTAARAASRKYLVLGILAELAVFVVLKYTDFLIQNINTLSHAQIPLPRFLLPFGISYYTFQTIGYMVDVYWNRTEAESNPAHYALFVSFFPQLAQGPIGRFKGLSPQLKNGNAFVWNNIREGLERILWGLFKKMLLADWAAVFRQAIFANPEKYSGVAILGVLFYTVELYGNFSGGIDVMIGAARLFGVRLDENFRQPFFARSVTEFWQRWHITLGTWMKDYVFYPLVQSKGFKKLGKGARRIFGKNVGRAVPLALANLIVFFFVGIWHGATWGNIGWGLYNGVIIALSVLRGEYSVIKQKLRINDRSRPWQLFCILRTFALMNLSWYFDCADSFAKAKTMIRYSLTRFAPGELLQISSGQWGKAFIPIALTVLGIGVFILFLNSLYKERVGEKPVAKKPLAWSCVAGAAILLLIAYFGPTAPAGGFIYAQF